MHRADGSENPFTADAEGNGVITIAEMTPLEPSTETEVSLLALAYYSDGQTYGELPGDAGLNGHVHVFWMMPAETAE